MRSNNIQVNIAEAKAKTPTLTIDAIKKNCPSAFTEKKSKERSEKYIHMPTSKVLMDMLALGWECIEAREIKKHKGETGYQKHCLRFRNYHYEIEGGLFPEIILTNAHDCTGGFIFRAGLFRFVCSNGLVIADKEFGQIKIRHMGYSFEAVKEACEYVVKNIPMMVTQISKLQSFKMTDEQMAEYALAAQQLRWKGETPVSVDDLLESSRKEDEGNDLWVVYNRIQEKLMNGGYNTAENDKGKTRKVRAVKNFSQQIQLNEGLWELNERVLNNLPLIEA